MNYNLEEESRLDFDNVEEIYAASQENALFAVLLLSIIYNWFTTRPPRLYFGLVAVFIQVNTISLFLF
jgi:hypothetical protein